MVPGFVQIVLTLVIWLIPIWPMWIIHGKAGLSRWWLFLLVIPSLGVLVLLFITAYSRWRTEDVAERFS